MRHVAPAASVRVLPWKPQRKVRCWLIWTHWSNMMLSRSRTWNHCAPSSQERSYHNVNALNIKAASCISCRGLIVVLLWPIRSGQLDLRSWWGSPRPRSTSAGPTEAPCAPSLCATGERSVPPPCSDCSLNGERWAGLLFLMCQSSLLRIKRAFLIEEQKIVVKVLKAQAQSQKSK